MQDCLLPLCLQLCLHSLEHLCARMFHSDCIGLLTAVKL